jgi:hypothetical protein
MQYVRMDEWNARVILEIDVMVFKHAIANFPLGLRYFVSRFGNLSVMVFLLLNMVI